MLPISKTLEQVRLSRRQAAIVRDLEMLGGAIGYRHEWDDRTNRCSGASKPGGRLLRAVLGDHFFLEPTVLIFSEFEGNVEFLACMVELKALTHIGIVDSPSVADRIIDFLIELPNVVYVSLYGTSVTREGVAKMATLTHLQGLCVSHTCVLPSELGSLQAMFRNAKIHLDNDSPRTDFRTLLASDDA